MKLELIYIGEQQSRFTKGEKYKASSSTSDTGIMGSTTFIDRDGVPFEISNDILHHFFRSVRDWREEQINRVLDEKG